MRIAIFETLNDHTAAIVLDGNILYRPDIARKGARELSQAVFGNAIEAIIATEWFFNEAFFNECKARDWPLTIVLVNKRQPSNAHVAMAMKAGVKLIGTAEEEGVSCFVSGLRVLERSVKQDLIPHETYSPSKSKSVTLIGSGLVNLITAYALMNKGFSVKLIDASPDPRSQPSWEELGCSSGGGNARMFTLSEMDNYNCRTVHADMNCLFSKDISEQGWNIFGSKELNAQELNWIDEFQSVPVWLADQFNEDIFSLNAESWKYWQTWIDADPDLFAGSLYKNEILRVYADQGNYEAAVARQNGIDATKKIATNAEIAKEQPALKDAIDAGQIAGGVYVHGFTVGIHAFIDGLIGRLETKGAVFQWDTPIKGMRHNGIGQVTHLVSDVADYTVDNLVVSPGCYAGELLSTTACKGKIGGVLGAWLTLPCPEGELNNSLKLARKGHIVEDANITISKDETGNSAIIIGSGYGFTGFDPSNIDAELLGKMYDGVIDTAEKYFPSLYQKMVENGTLRDSLKYCVRPWTATSLGLFETLENNNGNKCIVTGGHNTGGFAQAPSIAIAVCSALEGSPHQMHYDYHPERFTQFQMETSYRNFDVRTVA
ncbi:NAD(P)/FAD-dependent oxidoreductase [Cochlodiniinecator piscidefendens]|uniref:NAD(P)/FAD-dependent oxidoreductase n=1 Tax=Cochlodiniinecator piscidefendens TaxID=2715756 RepID=UPI00140A390D|nr:FAD-dependent oxidoreductase [Cochlodiniinecator piscidefendens]